MKALLLVVSLLAASLSNVFASTAPSAPTAPSSTASYVSLNTVWKLQCQRDRILYVSNGQGRIDRYDVALGQALHPLNLGVDFSFMCCSETGLFIASAWQIFQVDEETQQLRELLALPDPSKYMFQGWICGVAANRSHVFYSEYFYGDDLIGSIDLTTGVSSRYLAGISHFFLVPTMLEDRLVCSGDFGEVDLLRTDPDGVPTRTLSGQALQSMTQFVAQSGRFLVSTMGTVLETSTMRKFKELACAVSAVLDLGGGSSLILSQDKLRYYNTTWDLIGEQPVLGTARTVVGWGGNWFVLHELCETGETTFERIDFSKFVKPAAGSLRTHGEPVNGLLSFIDKRGDLVQAASRQAALMIWSSSQRDITRVVPLAGVPLTLLYEPNEDAVYYAFDTAQWIWRVDLVTGISEPYGVGRISTFDWFEAKSGALIGGLGGFVPRELDSAGVSKNWLPQQLRRYSLHGPRMMTQLYCPARSEWFTLDVVGAFSSLAVNLSRCARGTLVTPSVRLARFDYHNSDGQLGLLGLSGSADELVVSDGQIFNGVTGKRLGKLALTPWAVAWAPFQGTERLYSVGLSEGRSLLERHLPGQVAVDASVSVEGVPRCLFVLSNGTLLLETDLNGAPRQIILDTNLQVLSIDNAGEPRRLTNFSLQTVTGPAEDLLTLGFVFSQNCGKRLFLRAVGPSLRQFGINEVLQDPWLKASDPKGYWTVENDNWGDSYLLDYVRRTTTWLHAFPLLEGSLDAAVLFYSEDMANTLQIGGGGAQSGHVLAEIYDDEDASCTARLLNLSARCKVTPQAPAIAGFMVQGDKPMKLLVRGVGAKLSGYGVAAPLKNPIIHLYSGQTVLAQNDDWSADSTKVAALKAAFAKTGAFSLDDASKDSALIVELPRGSYTVWLEGAEKSSGVALLEIYEIPDN